MLISTMTKKLVYDEFGEMLFTHFGVSGPVIISSSAVIGNKNIKGYKLKYRFEAGSG